MKITNKSYIRRLIKSKKNELDLNLKEHMDKSIYNKVINSKEYKNSKTIFVYVSTNSEVNTHQMIERFLEDGKIVCIPKVISKDFGMKAVIIKSFADLELGHYNILEPNNNCKDILKNNIDLVFVPGLAFDKMGGRIGYGGGFYDKYLKDLSTKVKKIGLCYEFQILKDIPMESFDIRINKIVTEKLEYDVF